MHDKRNDKWVVRVTIGAFALLVLSLVFAAATAHAKLGQHQTGHKYYVCKYVGEPGDFETLQTGQNPIFVDGHSIPTWPYVSEGDDFADAQGHSVVIAGPYDKKLDPEPGIDQCPGSESPSPTITPTPTDTPSPSTSPSETPPPTSTPPPSSTHTPTPPTSHTHTPPPVSRGPSSSPPPKTAFTGLGSKGTLAAGLAGLLALLGTLALRVTSKKKA